MTTTIDLSGFNLGQLKSLRDDVEKQIKARQQLDIQEAREKIMAIASSLGVDVQTLLAGAKKQKVAKEKGEKIAAVFRNPTNASQTWSGRGRQPKWMADGLAGGKTIEEFRI